MTGLVLSLFPGIGLLDRAFEETGFCVVRGPDVLWGGDVHRFHPPAGVFDGVIGGPPCQSFSPLRRLQEAHGYQPRHGNLIPEYERVVAEAAPTWFVMENVPNAPGPVIGGYQVHRQILNNRWLGEDQDRKRAISFGTKDGQPLHIECAALMASERFVAVTSKGSVHTPWSLLEKQAVGAGDSAHGYKRQTVGAVTSSDGAGKVRMQRYKLPDAIRLQGLPEDFLSEAPFTVEGKMRVVANGVPLPMGRAIAQAVKRAMAAPAGVPS